MTSVYFGPQIEDYVPLHVYYGTFFFLAIVGIMTLAWAQSPQVQAGAKVILWGSFLAFVLPFARALFVAITFMFSGYHGG